jgi:excisionase family DNA binding protein
MKDIRPGLLESDRVYSARTLAKVLHVSVRTIYNLASRRELPFVKITPESDMRFPGWQIKQWLDAKIEK